MAQITKQFIGTIVQIDATKVRSAVAQDGIRELLIFFFVLKKTSTCSI